MLVEFLPRRYPDRFSLQGSKFTNHAMGQSWDLCDPALDPLEVSALNVQVCLLSAHDQAPAALLCCGQSLTADFRVQGGPGRGELQALLRSCSTSSVRLFRQRLGSDQSRAHCGACRSMGFTQLADVRCQLSWLAVCRV